MRVVWREIARRDLRAIISYIAARNVAAAEDIGARLRLCAERISEHPFLYREGRVPGTREALIHPNYLLIYRVGNDVIEVLAVIHSRQQYPPPE